MRSLLLGMSIVFSALSVLSCKPRDSSQTQNGSSQNGGPATRGVETSRPETARETSGKGEMATTANIHPKTFIFYYTLRPETNGNYQFDITYETDAQSTPDLNQTFEPLMGTAVGRFEAVSDSGDRFEATIRSYQLVSLRYTTGTDKIQYNSTKIDSGSDLTSSEMSASAFDGRAPHKVVRELGAQGYVLTTKVYLSNGTRCGGPSKNLMVLIHSSRRDEVVVVNNQSGKFTKFSLDLGPRMRGLCTEPFDLDEIKTVFQTSTP